MFSQVISFVITCIRRLFSYFASNYVLAAGAFLVIFHFLIIVIDKFRKLVK